MKKELTIISLLIILSINFSFALQLEIQNQKLTQGETLLAKLTADFQEPIEKSDITFYEQRKQVTFEYDLASYENTYYFYIYLNKQGNYTLEIKDILYKEDTLKSETLNHEMNIQQANNSLSIKPGIITTSNNELFLKNTGNENLNINYKYQEQEQTLNLTPEQSTTIQINPIQGLSFITLESYQTFTIPAIYYSLNPSTDYEIEITPNIFHAYITNQTQYYEIELYNPNNYDITDLNINTGLDFINTTYSNTIPSKQSTIANISVSPFKQGYVKSNISFTYNDKSLSIPLEVYSLTENETFEDIETSQSCEDFQGVICASGYTCSGDYKFTQEGPCCLATCEEAPSYNPFEPEKEDESGYGWLWAIIIFVILGIAGFFIYKKFKKAPAKKQDALKKTTQEQSKRLSGGLARN